MAGSVVWKHQMGQWEAGYNKPIRSLISGVWRLTLSTSLTLLTSSRNVPDRKVRARHTFLVSWTPDTSQVLLQNYCRIAEICFTDESQSNKHNVTSFDDKGFKLISETPSSKRILPEKGFKFVFSGQNFTIQKPITNTEPWVVYLTLKELVLGLQTGCFP